MTVPHAYPAPRPQPAWQRGLLRIGTAAWWALCMLQSYRRSVARAAKTAVWGRWRRPVPAVDGEPIRHHPDRLRRRLPRWDPSWLRQLDAEITARLPEELRIELARNLTKLTSRGSGS